MAKTTAELNQKLDQQGSSFAKLDVQSRLDVWRNKHFDKLSALSGSPDAARKIFVVCMNSISKNPNLLGCTFESLSNCILQSFELNLFPGPFQECSYVPLKNGRLSYAARRDVYEANFWPQYQGIVKLMRNAGNKSVIARVVFENDFFQYDEGERPPKYVPAVVLGKQRGKPLFAYSTVCTDQNFWQVEVMSLEQIDDIKKRSAGSKKDDSPWNSKYLDDQYAMFAKCPLKRISKWCTKSAELVRALELDNVVDGDPALQSPYLVPEMNLSDGASAPPEEPGAEEPQAPSNPVQAALPAPVGGQTLELKTADGSRSVSVVVPAAESEDVSFKQEWIDKDKK